MRTFKRCLSAFIAVTMTFTMLMTLGIAEDSAGYSPEANVPEGVTASADAVPDATVTDDGESNLRSVAEAAREATTAFITPPDETAGVYDNSISGTLWIDMFEDIGNGIYSGDGIRQPSEESLAGYDVSLYAADNLSDVLHTVQTDSRGEYIFTGLEPGSYAVGISSGTLGDVEYLLPFTGISGDNRFHAPDETTDYKTAFSGTVNVDADTHAAGIDAGMRTPPMIQPMFVSNGFAVTGTVTGTYDTLDDAIAAINNAAGNQTATITVTNSDSINNYAALIINAGKNVTITSSSSVVTITQPHSYRHFNVNGSLTLQNIILDTSGNSPYGGVQVNNGGTLIMSTGAVIENCAGGYGGGVYVSGTVASFTMNDNAVIQDCKGSKGGGVCVSGASATFTMNDAAVIQYCVSSGGGGGGVYLDSGGSFTMNNGKISNNYIAATAGTGNGGGVYAYTSCTFTMEDGEISDNTASASTSNAYAGAGGGVSLSGANFTMKGGKIINNTATKGTLEGFGGGVSMYMAGFFMYGGEISGNRTSTLGCTYGRGGGVSMSGGDTFIMHNGVITGNTADQYGGGVHVLDQFTMYGGTISGNTASTTGIGYGGGVSVVPGLNTNRPTFNMTGGTISGNTASTAADGYGGGVYISNGSVKNTKYPVAFTMSGAEISNNEASTVAAANGYGGGVYISNNFSDANIQPVSFTVNNGDIKSNKASLGGGVYLGDNGVFTMNGTSIDRNEAVNGGGIYDSYNASITLNSMTISNNVATNDGGGIWLYHMDNLKTDSVTFSGNDASQGYQWTVTAPNDAYQANDAQIYNDNIINTSTTSQKNSTTFTNVYNNLDINFYDPTTITKYTITYNSNGGTPVPSKDIISGRKAATPVAPQLAGYTFVGWYTDNNTFQAPWIFNTYLVASDITLYAKWSVIAYSGGGSKSVSTVTDVGTYWIEVPEAKTMAKNALDEKLDYARSRRDTITGIRKNSLLVLAESGLRYRHDTVVDGAVQVRVYIDDPSKTTKDILVSGYVKGEAIDNIKAKFEKKFQNKLAVIGLDQQGSFGIKVQIAAKVDLSGMNTKNLYFYSYNKSTGKYVRIETEYRIDENGYLHFSTMQGGYIIISDGPLYKLGAEQNSGTQLHNPETGGDSPSETRVAANPSSLTYGNDNPETGGDSPEEIWITGNSSPMTIENFTSDGGDEPEIMLSASTSQNESNALKRGSYINIKTAAVSFVVLFAVILVGVCILRLRNFRRYNGR